MTDDFLKNQETCIKLKSIKNSTEECKMAKHIILTTKKQTNKQTKKKTEPIGNSQQNQMTE